MIFRPNQQPSFAGVQVWRPHSTAGGASTWWDNNGAIAGCVAAYQPKGAADLANSYINLQNPGTNNAAPGTAPTFNTNTGWTFNGTTQYLTAGVVPSSSWSFLIRFANVASGGTDALFGLHASASERLNFYAKYTDNAAYYRYGTTDASVAAGGYTSGVTGLVGTKVYKNGVDQSLTISGTLSTLKQIYIGAYNGPSGATAYAAYDCIAFAAYNVVLSAGEVATITTAMNAL